MSAIRQKSRCRDLWAKTMPASLLKINQSKR
nr:MAG TPA: hypothetical protein [Caudoviricetes sp.]